MGLTVTNGIEKGIAQVIYQSFLISCRVSSVFNKDVKNYGKSGMIDLTNEETCWSSDSGSPQFIQYGPIEDEIDTIKTISIMFQGGYTAKSLQLFVKFTNSSDWILQDTLIPTDSSLLQTFQPSQSAIGQERRLEYFKLVFNSSHDLYGRIVIYKLQIN